MDASVISTHTTKTEALQIFRHIQYLTLMKEYRIYESIFKTCGPKKQYMYSSHFQSLNII